MAKKAHTPKPRASTPEDVALGTLIRARRIEAGMSQDELAGKLGVSFQQVQKYEKGVNRVNAIRLQAIAKALDESMDYFTGTPTKTTSQLMTLMTDAPSQRLLRAFAGIGDQALRYKVVGLVESISGKAA